MKIVEQETLVLKKKIRQLTMKQGSAIDNEVTFDLVDIMKVYTKVVQKTYS